MSLTYEYADRTERLENKEWDQIWLEEAPDTTRPRVWLIGDSIFVGTLHAMNPLLDGEWLVDGLSTSKALDNPHFRAQIRLCGEQEGTRRVIVFNNGLHGWHLDDETAYPAAYEKMVVWLKETYPDAKLVLSLTTYVTDSQRDARVQARNAAAVAVAAKYDLPVIDNYTLVKNNPSLISGDGVHLADYRPLCEEIIRCIRPYM